MHTHINLNVCVYDGYDKYGRIGCKGIEKRILRCAVKDDNRENPLLIVKFDFCFRITDTYADISIGLHF